MAKLLMQDLIVLRFMALLSRQLDFFPFFFLPLLFFPIQLQTFYTKYFEALFRLR